MEPVSDSDPHWARKIRNLEISVQRTNRSPKKSCQEGRLGPTPVPRGQSFALSALRMHGFDNDIKSQAPSNLTAITQVALTI